MKTTPASFDATSAELDVIEKIAVRAVAMAQQSGINYGNLTAEMDITACHCNGMPLDLDRLLAADDFNFAHDVFGIARHINRKTGEIQDFFVPRCARSTPPRLAIVHRPLAIPSSASSAKSAVTHEPGKARN